MTDSGATKSPDTSSRIGILPVPTAPPSNDELEAEIIQLAARIAAATYRLLALVAELDARGAVTCRKACALPRLRDLNIDPRIA